MAQRAPWGQARIEVIALADEIREDLERRVPVRQIFARLRESGRVTMGQSAFYQWVSELRKEANPSREAAATPLPEARPVGVAGASLPFSRTATASLPALRFSEAPVEDKLWDGGTIAAPADQPAIKPTEEEPSDGTD